LLFLSSLFLFLAFFYLFPAALGFFYFFGAGFVGAGGGSGFAS